MERKRGREGAGAQMEINRVREEKSNEQRWLRILKSARERESKRDGETKKQTEDKKCKTRSKTHG